MKTGIKICIIHKLNVVDRWIDVLRFSSDLHRLCEEYKRCKMYLLGYFKGKRSKTWFESLVTPKHLFYLLKLRLV